MRKKSWAVEPGNEPHTLKNLELVPYLQVMLAASYWSLLAPAIELAEQSDIYGQLVFLPVSLGFTAGALFVYMADILLPILVCCWSELFVRSTLRISYRRGGRRGGGGIEGVGGGWGIQPQSMYIS